MYGEVLGVLCEETTTGLKVVEVVNDTPAMAGIQWVISLNKSTEQI